MSWLLIATICCLTLLSCKKDSDQTIETFTGSLPIVQTQTARTAVAGQDIRSNVRCQLSSVSGSLYFSRFDIQKVSPTHFTIAAEALYKDWNTQVGMPVMWTLDTMVSINTVNPGTYVLDFYNDVKLVKSDTVYVD